jgi:hypothetical protein
MKKVIIINTPWFDDKTFIGSVGILLSKSTSYEFAEVEITFKNKKIIVFLDAKDYAPYTTLLEELF